MPPGTLQPAADIPGTGSVWLLGYFGTELQYRWVAVDAGTGPTEPGEPGNKPPGTDQPQPKSPTAPTPGRVNPAIGPYGSTR